MTRGTDVTDFRRIYRTATTETFPDKITVTYKKLEDLRYGENPNQPAALIGSSKLAEQVDLQLLKSGEKGMSATNQLDAAHGLYLTRFFTDPIFAVMKHGVPSGMAESRGRSLEETLRLAWNADARSAFGSVVVTNRPLNNESSEFLCEKYVECVVAPDFEEGVMAQFGNKRNLRVLKYSGASAIPAFSEDPDEGMYSMISLPNGRNVVQKPYKTSIRSAADLITDPLVWHNDNAYIVHRDPTKSELKDLIFAWYVNLGVRSNGIVLAKDGVTLAVGTGQQERVGAVEQAIVKAYQKAMDREGVVYNPLLGIVSAAILPQNPLADAVCSSDAFFPFRDSIDLLASVGVSAIIQPGGSTRDYEVIQAVNEDGMAMAYTLERCFAHF